MSDEKAVNEKLDALADAILDSRSPRTADVPQKLVSAYPDVVIAVRGGVAEVIENTEGLDVLIVDYDNGESYEPLDGPDSPSEEDYVLTDTGNLGASTMVTSVGHPHSETFSEYDDAIAYVRDRMKKERFYPNVWYMDDHGGLTLVTGEAYEG